LNIKDRTAKKSVQFFGLFRSPNGKQFVIEAQSNDNKDRWIGVWKDGKFLELDHQHDDAWIGGPGISSWRGGDSDFGWFDDGQIYFQSEKTGYSHLYLLSIQNKNITALTAGNFEVMNLQFFAKKKVFFANMNRNEPGRFLPCKIDPKLPLGWISLLPPKKLLGIEPGFTEIFVAPSGEQMVYRFSNMESPWELAIREKGKVDWQVVTHSTSPEFERYAWNKGKVISFPGMDGKSVYARVYQPEKAVKNSAAVIFVHGAGYLQNAHHWWSNYYREFMFHHFLTERGYTVLDIDYRASSGYGRDWRTAIYRHMGGWDLNDHLSGRSYLINELNINPKKVGMYGGSYGGFMTLMALFTTPDSFACGAALRSVTDWAHYNHGYTANILNTPETDSLAFAKSSPINFAKNLKNPLLMLHGMVDDNVQFQDIVRLSQRLIELEKNQWELAVYPVENHGFKERSSWLDEYKRIFKLFEQHLLH
jgi:dipeptidyl aminopeptidase/acylaminoacyl peptidase